MCFYTDLDLTTEFRKLHKSGLYKLYIYTRKCFKKKKTAKLSDMVIPLLVSTKVVNAQTWEFRHKHTGARKGK